MGLFDRIKKWATNNTRLVFALLRMFKPILVLKEFAIITRFDDVQEVLSRPDIFDVTYEEKMRVVTNGSNFFLGMSDTPTYVRDVSNMRIVMPRFDLESIITPMIERLTTEILSESTGRMDIIKEYTKRVPARFIRDYIGVPGPSEDDLINWNTLLFEYLFSPTIPPEVEQGAIEGAAGMREHIDQLIVNRKSIGEKNDDVLNRCLALQKANTPGMADEEIRNNLIGTIIGAIPTTANCATLVIDYLLDHPKLLEKAKVAAQENDLETMQQFVLESLRFNSFGPGVFRIAKEDYTVAAGYFRSKKIKKGTSVLALTESAMFDGRKVKSPRDFKLDRPSYQYMQFGYGMHTCFGYHINLIQIPIIVKNLLKCDNLQRAAGKEGQLKIQGSFPVSMTMEFTPPSAHSSKIDRNEQSLATETSS